MNVTNISTDIALHLRYQVIVKFYIDLSGLFGNDCQVLHFILSFSELINMAKHLDGLLLQLLVFGV